MRIIKLAWVGTRTDNAGPTVAFLREVLGLRLELDQPGFWMLKLPDGSRVEVFGPDSLVNRHFTTGPVAGFLVDDIQDAAAELRSADELGTWVPSSGRCSGRVDDASRVTRKCGCQADDLAAPTAYGLPRP